MEFGKYNRPWLRFYKDPSPDVNIPEISIYELFEKSAKKNSERVSHNYFGRKVRYGTFLRQVDEMAVRLIDLGVKAGDTVTVCLPNIPEALISFYAVNRIGAVSSFVHPLSSADEMKYYIRLTTSRFLITIDSVLDKIGEFIDSTRLIHVIVASPSDSMPLLMKTVYNFSQKKKGVIVSYPKAINAKFISFHKLLKEGADKTKKRFYFFSRRNLPDYASADSPAVILFSGGTCGNPKGIVLSNKNFNALALTSKAAVEVIDKKDSVLAIMPIFHGFGLGVCIHTVQSSGACSVLIPRFNSKEFKNLIYKYRPTVLIGVPTLYETMINDSSFSKTKLGFLRVVISGGDTLTVSLKNKIDDFLRLHGARLQVREGYGLTECVTGTCLTPQNDYRDGSIGIPYPNHLYKIIDVNSTKTLGLCDEGEICISGPTVMLGYYNNEDETSKVIFEDENGTRWLRTGDVGMMDADGFVYFRQRIKRIIVSSGYNLYPKYIEDVICAHPAVSLCCVIGIDHPYKIHVAKAFIVLKKNVQITDELKAEIKARTEKKLAKYSWPYEYEFRDSLPLTRLGKISSRLLEDEERAKGKIKDN